MSPPLAKKIPHRTELHGDERVDDYYWLRNRDDPAVIEYLEAENTYTQLRMGHTAKLQKSVYDEMLGHIVEDDTSVPAREDDYWYYYRTVEGKAYRIYARKKGRVDAPEEILLDVNALAAGKKYTSLGVYEVSPDHSLLAYSVDETGAERFTVFIKDLKTGEILPDRIEGTYYSLAWANDNRTLFYNTVDEANRPYRLYKHTLGTDAKADVLVYEEEDDRYFLDVERTRSEAFLLLTLESAITTEIHFLDAGKPDGEFRVIHPRQQKMEYSVDHRGDHFFILTNENAINFELKRTPVSKPEKVNWQSVIAHREDVTIRSIEAFQDFMVIYEREEGLPQLRVRGFEGTGIDDHRIELPEATYDAWPQSNYEFDTKTLRFAYESLTTPRSVFDYDVVKKSRELKKEKPVRHYDRNEYVSERMFATAPDGVKVPISVVFRRSTPRDGSAPMLLHGYGSYGYPYDVGFNSNWLSLLDRGFVVGIAHIRGGGEMGRKWKLDGKFEKKMNTFNDFIACAEHLIDGGYTRADRFIITGRSAGGLLMGAVTNLRPDLFRAVVAGVPFVDVVNTMLDETIPLTVVEWEEWGNPKEAEAYRTILAYSPYDNVGAKEYPAILVTAGLNDPRVQYWEPAKWVAKLRSLKTDSNALLLKTNMGAGHAGASGRYGRLEERAFEYAFVLDQVGLSE